MFATFLYQATHPDCLGVQIGLKIGLIIFKCVASLILNEKDGADFILLIRKIVAM